MSPIINVFPAGKETMEEEQFWEERWLLRTENNFQQATTSYTDPIKPRNYTDYSLIPHTEPYPAIYVGTYR